MAPPLTAAKAKTAALADVAKQAMGAILGQAFQWDGRLQSRNANAPNIFSGAGVPSATTIPGRARVGDGYWDVSTPALWLCTVAGAPGSWLNVSSSIVASLQITPGDPGLDTTVAGSLNLGSTNATSVNIDPPTTIDNALAANSIQVVAGDPGIDTTAAGVLAFGSTNATQIDIDPDLQFSAHLISNAGGTPGTSNLGANITSATFTGNDTRGKIVVVAAIGGLAANTRIATCTWASSFGAITPFPLLVDQTSGAGLAVLNFYSGAESATTFDLFCDQALVLGTYTLRYINIG